MSQGAIFVIGVIIFAITVYGTVMAGGIALTKVMLHQEPQQPFKLDDALEAAKMP